MDELSRALLIILGMFGFFMWERRYQRTSELTITLKIVQRELLAEKYDITYATRGEITALELRNDISRITHTVSPRSEELQCSLFFKNREGRGINKTILSRDTASGLVGRMYYFRRNELLGRVLYNQGGTTKNKQVRALMDDIVSAMNAQHHKKEREAHTIK